MIIINSNISPACHLLSNYPCLNRNVIGCGLKKVKFETSALVCSEIAATRNMTIIRVHVSSMNTSESVSVGKK